ncbi:MAG: ABC transporter ATP-binding protein [Acidobacteria bacterium]|nr:ABC transporter ATP-binding protein [Acidobacteriota bacterium]MBU4306874.1 ABC transporter ATP-binding protein [Acidobacteriota bacterium]MBU4403991.1 ABC transporter ATP-binding protein [Acidobacteriota bacterium]MCG2810288.1 ABC transporter ATP-binding protein [Candidatus Aminicenantes bacterium]
MLEVHGLKKRYGHFFAVNGIDFTVKPGEVLGYLGPNGAGKSTTVKILTGLLTASQGDIRYCGRDVRADLTWFQHRLGYVPEQAEIYSHMSAWEYLLLVGRLRRLPESLLVKKANSLLELFHLDSFAHHAISSYSKGMKQKVLIIAALIHDPEVLIFDEPLSGLDASMVLVFRHLVRELATRGKTIFFSSHGMDEVEKICSRVLIIHQGSIVAHDSVSNLRQLLAAPSLEDVFRQLVIREDPREVAGAIASVVSGSA